MYASVRRPSGDALAALLDGLAAEDVTYPEVGATGDPTLPAGYHHDRRSVSLGHDEHSFRRGQEALRRWQAHYRAGATVTPADAPLVTGTNVVVTVRLGLLFTLAPCRIVSVADDAEHFGFAYGTLPGHPEQGEEAFHVRRAADGEVTFHVVVFSRPAAVLARLGGPIGRLVQGRVTEAYLEGVRQFVAGGEG